MRINKGIRFTKFLSVLLPIGKTIDGCWPTVPLNAFVYGNLYTEDV